jgi:hypothetical protein
MKISKNSERTDCGEMNQLDERRDKVCQRIKQLGKNCQSNVRALALHVFSLRSRSPGFDEIIVSTAYAKSYELQHCVPTAGNGSFDLK